MSKRTIVTVTKTGAKFFLYVRKPTGKEIPCTGEAHSNAFIDNCGLCMPRWGVVAELEPKLSAEKLAEVLASGYAVAMNDLAEETYRAIPHELLVGVQTKGSSFYAIVPSDGTCGECESMPTGKDGRASFCKAHR